MTPQVKPLVSRHIEMSAFDPLRTFGPLQKGGFLHKEIIRACATLLR